MVKEWVSIAIGCSIGGFLLLLAGLIVIIFFCRAHKRNKCYEKNLKVETPEGYTTFSLHKPGMPPLPSGQGRPSSLLGSVWTTQATSTIQPAFPTHPNETTKDKSNNGSAVKRNESDTSYDKMSSTATAHQTSLAANEQKPVEKYSSSVDRRTSTGSVDVSSSGSYGSQVELITRDRKSSDKNKEKERKKDAARSRDFQEPDMSVIVEESASKLSVTQQQLLYPGPPSSQSTGVPTVPDDLSPVPKPYSAQVLNRNRSVDSTRPSDQMERPRTIFPPPTASSSEESNHVSVEIHPNPKQRIKSTTSDDKRLINDAFRFLDEFD